MKMISRYLLVVLPTILLAQNVAENIQKEEPLQNVGEIPENNLPEINLPEINLPEIKLPAASPPQSNLPPKRPSIITDQKERVDVNTQEVNNLLSQYKAINNQVSSEMSAIKEKKAAAHEMKNMLKGYELQLSDSDKIEAEHIRSQLVNKKPVIPNNSDTEAEIPADAHAINPQKPLLPLRQSFEHIKIRDSDECGQEAHQHCSRAILKNNFITLACLQQVAGEKEKLSAGCSNYLWNFKKNITRSDSTEIAAKGACKEDILNAHPECLDHMIGSGKLISCMLDYRQEDYVGEACRAFLTPLASIIYGDYTLICGFMESCENDILSNECGRIEKYNVNTKDLHSQGETVACLERAMTNKPADVTDSCKKSIKELTTLQSDDWHLDRNLFSKCRVDRETLCPSTEVGEGRVYRCLFRKRKSNKMTKACKSAIDLREKIISRNVFASYGIRTTCDHDMRVLKCENKELNAFGDQVTHNLGLIELMNCIQEATENPKNKQHEVGNQCVESLNSYKQYLVDNYNLSPKVVMSCKEEWRVHCRGKDIDETEGAALHCLVNRVGGALKAGLKSAEKDGETGINTDRESVCMNSLKELVKVSDVASNPTLDKALIHSCQASIDTYCRSAFESEDPAEIVPCLLSNIHRERVSKNCKEHLYDIQYFVSRDFSLDNRFKRSCKADVELACHQDSFHQKSTDIKMPMWNLIVSCLYRHIHPKIELGNEKEDHSSVIKDSYHTVSGKCQREVQRVMKNRLLNTNLNPELEKNCLTAIGDLCSGDDWENEFTDEIDCLRHKLEKKMDDDKNAEKARDYYPSCAKVVDEVTVIEVEETGLLNGPVRKACQKEIDVHCQDEIAKTGEVIECLIKHKHDKDFNLKCEAQVTHIQLIGTATLKFNVAFLKFCHRELSELCSNHKSKNEVVNCLSTAITQDIQNDNSPRVTESCRNELHSQLLDRSEDIRLQPELFKACAGDVQTYCEKEGAGEGRAQECLREHANQLSEDCSRELFHVMQETAKDASIDWPLVNACKTAAEEHCPKELVSKVEGSLLKCLIHHKGKEGINANCKKAVRIRHMEQFTDARLNPTLLHHCSNEINTHCMHYHENKDKISGYLMRCLRDVFREQGDEEEEKTSKKSKKSKKHKEKRKMNDKCYEAVGNELRSVEKSSNPAILDPEIRKFCKNAVEKHCKSRQDDQIECLRIKFSKGELDYDMECANVVGKLLREGKSDATVDAALDGACAMDMQTHCKNVPHGHGRKLHCLLALVDTEAGRQQLRSECVKKLEQRQNMWSRAEALKLNGWEDFDVVVQAVMKSEHRNMWVGILFGVIGLILALGCLCGNLSSRRYSEYEKLR